MQSSVPAQKYGATINYVNVYVSFISLVRICVYFLCLKHFLECWSDKIGFLMTSPLALWNWDGHFHFYQNMLWTNRLTEKMLR